jgi:sulfate-transporting ATPase
VTNLVVRYGGVTAVGGLSMNLHPGKVVGLIGPNGAGKTSAIDAITGTTRVASGSIVLDAKAIERWPAHARARAGLSQSFQSLELFEDMTVYENILTAAEPRDALAYVSNLAYERAASLPPAAVDAVELFGLWDELDKLPGELPYGRKRLVAIARAAASNPSVLLLDEPAAGLDDATATRLGVLIRTLADTRGIAVMLVEHHIGLVLSVADYIYCMDFGQPIAEGTPDQIRRNQRVIDAYLGADSERSGSQTGRPHVERVAERSGDSTGRRHVEQLRRAAASPANLVHS